MSNTENQNGRPTLIKWDGTIPAWGLFTLVLTLGLAWSSYSWNQMQNLNDRMTIRETNAAEYRKKVDQLEAQQREVHNGLAALKSDVSLVKELLLRFEKRFEGKR
jgi:uncharacterized protein HemX